MQGRWRFSHWLCVRHSERRIRKCKRAAGMRSSQRAAYKRLTQRLGCSASSICGSTCKFEHRFQDHPKRAGGRTKVSLDDCSNLVERSWEMVTWPIKGGIAKGREKKHADASVPRYSWGSPVHTKASTDRLAYAHRCLIKHASAHAVEQETSMIIHAMQRKNWNPKEMRSPSARVHSATKRIKD